MTTRAAFSRLLAGAARPLDLTGGALVTLDDNAAVVLVELGCIDLFAVRLDEGRPAGRWVPLGRAAAGTVLTAPPPGSRLSIVGRADPGAVLSTLPAARLPGLPQPGPDSGEGGRGALAPSAAEFVITVRQLVAGIDAGVTAIAESLFREMPPAAPLTLVSDGPTVVADTAAVRSADGVRWVRIAQGFARQEAVTERLTVGAEFCLTERDWLVAEGKTRLTSRVTGDLLADGSLWPMLASHLTTLLEAVERGVQRRDEVERAALLSQAARQSDAVRAVARSFDAVVRDAGGRVRLTDVAADPPDLAAVRLVASAMGFSVRAPGAWPPAGVRTDRVQEIALANNVRTRPIRLEGWWWKKDIGPLLGRRKADGQVIALLPAGGSYVVADPAADQVTRVTKAVAAELADEGLTLYRPLPAGLHRPGALLRFAVSGTRGDLVRIGWTSLIVAVIGLLAPIMTGWVLGDFVVRAQRDLIVEGALVVIAGALVAAVISVVQNVAALRLEGSAVASLQSAIWSRLLSLPASFFSQRSTGALAVAALGVNAAQEALSGVATVAALGLLTGSLNLVLVFFYDVRLALVAVGLVTICAAVCALLGYRQVLWQRRIYDNKRQLATQVFQLLTCLPMIRVAAAEDRAFLKWSATFVQGRVFAVRARRVQNLLVVFNAVFPLTCSVVLFAVVAGPLRGKVPIAAFLSFNAAFTLLTAAMLQFTGVAITSLSVIPLLERIAPILTAEPESAGVAASPGEMRGQIMLSHVSFRYGDDEPLVLDDVSLTVAPGEFVAIVGPTGCGKSTVLRLLLGFETATAGSVLFDGHDITQLDIGEVRRQCGVVLQNGELLAGDIKSNIIGASTAYTIDDAWTAARMACVDEDIAAMPMGMHTIMSEGGTTLSGGQRQRIMIARALVSRPRIVLLDEATSALDNPTQAVVAERMRQLNATRIIIAHRLSSVAGADRILVVDEGRIVQCGSYQELLADQPGLFASLASQQLT